MTPSFLNPLVSYHQIARPIYWKDQFPQGNPLDVEIGFGLGEILVSKACEHPERNFIGIEQLWERIYKTLQRVSTQENVPENIKILHLDACVVFEHLFRPKSIDNIYCLFPCPWPKKSHVKHRLFSQNFLTLLNSRLKNNGRLTIVTDYNPYFQWILTQIPTTGFQVETNTIAPQFNTKFERKWLAQGQQEFLEINLLKKTHQPIPVKEDIILKSYTVNTFDPQQFQFNDIKGAISIIFKEMLFDKKKQQGVILMLVSEENITQYFRVAIIKRKTNWCICKATGQTFFPTSGIAQALSSVYATAKVSHA